MSMVFCRGCGTQIHETATTCPHCGAPQITIRHASSASSRSTTQVNNLLVWILAFAPIIGLFLQAILAAALAPDNQFLSQLAVNYALHSGEYWWVTLALNIGLSIADELRLKRKGVNTSGFGRFAFLVPVYLWKRAKSLGHNQAYFWTWNVLFALTILM